LDHVSGGQLPFAHDKPYAEHLLAIGRDGVLEEGPETAVVAVSGDDGVFRIVGMVQIDDTVALALEGEVLGEPGVITVILRVRIFGREEVEAIGPLYPHSGTELDAGVLWVTPEDGL